MGTIINRNGKFFAQINRKGVRKSKTFARKADAKHWILVQETMSDASLAPASKISVSVCMSQYIETVVKQKPRCRHEMASLQYACQFAGLGDKVISQISTDDINAYIDTRLNTASRCTGKSIKTSSVSRQMSYLASFFNWAIEKKLIRENPCRQAKRLKSVPPRERVATNEEIERLKTVCGWDGKSVPVDKPQLVCAAFLLACCTGMRSGEMMRIERSWINGKTLTIPASATKTKKGRVIALNDQARSILSLVCSLGHEPSIWNLTDGVRDTIWRRIRDRADLGPVIDSEGREIQEGLHFHDGRATFCTWAASPGEDGAPRLDVLSLARQTGHQNLKMLMRYYRPDIASFADRLK